MTVTRRIAARRDVVCVIEALHRDRRVADDAVLGRFTHCGVTIETGRRPDWIDGGLEGEEEWRIEWVKGYEGLHLAHAFAETGDDRYLETWTDLVSSFTEQVPVGLDSSDVSARRIQNWIYALQRFSATTELDDAFVAVVTNRLAHDVDHLREHLTAERNHRTLELYALVIAALALPSIDPDRCLLAFALDEMESNARTDLWTDGTHRECSTDYHHIVLRSFLGTIANARDAGILLSTAFLDRVERACDWAMHVQRPDGTTPSFSDGDNADHRAVLALAADLFDRADFRWVATGGHAGAPPRPTNVTFPVGGYVVQRSGWGTDRAYDEERFALLDCGPLGDGGHGHYDQLHVELVAGREVIAVDPGRYTYTDSAERHWFKGTIGHNTVMIDGLDQTPYRRGKPKGPVSTATLLPRRSHALLDLVEASVVSPRYDAVHTRRLAFCAGEYWVVHDVLRAATGHRYEARWHLAPSTLGLTTVERRGPDAWSVTTPTATFAIHGVDSVGLEGGWVSEQYGTRLAAPVIVATVTGVAADIVTVVTPGRHERDITVETRHGGCSVKVNEVGRHRVLDALEWPAGRERAVWRRHSTSGEWLEAILATGASS